MTCRPRAVHAHSRPRCKARPWSVAAAWVADDDGVDLAREHVVALLENRGVTALPQTVILPPGPHAESALELLRSAGEDETWRSIRQSITERGGLLVVALAPIRQEHR